MRIKNSQWYWSIKDDGDEAFVFLEVYDGTNKEKRLDVTFTAVQTEAIGAKMCEMAAKLRSYEIE